VLVTGGRGGGVAELVGLVLDVLGHLAELLAVLAGVVGAEEELETTLEVDTEVGLGAASVAPVQCAERCGARGCRSSHVGPRSRSRSGWSLLFNDPDLSGFPGSSFSSGPNSQPRPMLPGRERLGRESEVVLLTTLLANREYRVCPPDLSVVGVYSNSLVTYPNFCSTYAPTQALGAP
jgi:hypothetical protein